MSQEPNPSTQAESDANTNDSDGPVSHSAGDDARDANTAEPIRSTDAESDVVVETQPTLKPTILSLATVLVAGIAIVAYLFAEPTLLGTTERTEIAANLVVLLTVVGAGRFLLRLYVLTRTRYVVTPDAVRREYSLLYKTFSRELPLSKIRSHELRRSRVETVLGIGSVGFLTGSVSQSPTHLEFENVPHPDRVRRQVREQLPGKES
ncbi:PH domain-containing protein [Halobellus rarus]|uniref:PH domain-containing protein n=1 Tax=Halobellus rarus TaxID=1126237 RepID=A0ABD6CHP7_9EURY